METQALQRDALQAREEARTEALQARLEARVVEECHATMRAAGLSSGASRGRRNHVPSK